LEDIAPEGYVAEKGPNSISVAIDNGALDERDGVLVAHGSLAVKPITVDAFCILDDESLDGDGGSIFYGNRWPILKGS
jgi:hypothetical protein